MGMNDIEWESFRETNIKGIWPRWEPSSFEADRLRRFCQTLEFDQARQLLTRWYDHADKVGYKPTMGLLRTILGRATDHEAKQGGGPYRLFALTRDPVNPKRPGAGYTEYAWPTLPGPERCMAMAEATRERKIKMTGENWAIVRLWEHPAGEDDRITTTNGDGQRQRTHRAHA